MIIVPFPVIQKTPSRPVSYLFHIIHHENRRPQHRKHCACSPVQCGRRRLVGKLRRDPCPEQRRCHAEHKTPEIRLPADAKLLAAPVKAVKVMINTLVPTAVFSSYPNTLVRIRSIIMPPPAPIKPQMNPTMIPQMTDWMTRFLPLT